MKERLLGQIVLLYNHIISWRIINLDNKISKRLKNALVHNICREMNVSFGNKYPGKQFYVIRSSHDGNGLFSEVFHVVEHIKIALEKGAIPIVDMKFYPNRCMQTIYDIGNENAWEYCFEQLCPYALDDIYKSKNVILSSGTIPVGRDAGLSANIEKIKISHKIVETYIHLNPNLLNDVNNTYQNLNMNNKKIIGVICRGTDYVKGTPKGHSKIPSLEEMVIKIQEFMKTKEYDFIFLSTEDEDIKESLKAIFNDKLIWSQKMYINKLEMNGWMVDFLKRKTKEYKHEKMKEYCVSTYLLAKCDALIAPLIGASWGAMVIKEEYESSYIFNLGCY